MKKIYLLFLLTTFFLGKTNAQYVVFGDNYAPGVTFVAFGGSVNTLSIDNTQFNTGSASLKIPVTTGYTGGALVAATPKDLSTYNALTFWAKNDMPAFKLDGVGIGNTAADATTVYAIERNGVTLSSTWTKYYIPIPVASKLTAEIGLFHFAEGSGQGAYNIWIDDIQYENVPGGIIGTPTAIFKTETQTKEVGATFAPNDCFSTYPVNSVNQQMQTSRAYFTWTPNPAEIASFNATGIGTALAVGSTTITGKLGDVNAAGTLTLNVTPAVAPVVAAPTPTTASADVKSLFSDAYTNIAVETWRAGWSTCCNTLTDLLIAGNPTKKYDLFHFTGIEFFGAPVDGTVYDMLHIDVWTPNNAKQFTIRLVDANAPPKEANVTKIPAQNTWVSYDIPLSDFALPLKTKISQMLFLVATSTSGTYFIDNVYFWKSSTLPIVLTDFKVAQRGKTNVLTWTTSSEINSKAFITERSANGTDWTTLQHINASGNSNATIQYSAVDESPLKGINYYRIKLVDKDGKFRYSKIVALNSGLSIKNFTVFPNPFATDVKVSITSESVSMADVRILSLDGRVLMNRKMSLHTGDNIVVLNDLGNLSKGNYILEVITPNDKLIQKISKN